MRHAACMRSCGCSWLAPARLPCLPGFSTTRMTTACLPFRRALTPVALPPPPPSMPGRPRGPPPTHPASCPPPPCLALLCTYLSIAPQVCHLHRREGWDLLLLQVRTRGAMSVRGWGFVVAASQASGQEVAGGQGASHAWARHVLMLSNVGLCCTALLRPPSAPGSALGLACMPAAARSAPTARACLPRSTGRRLCRPHPSPPPPSSPCPMSAHPRPSPCPLTLPSSALPSPPPPYPPPPTGPRACWLSRTWLSGCGCPRSTRSTAWR